MSSSRKIERVVAIPPIAPGFGGPMHTATAVIAPGAFAATDPFFLMMDDRISTGGPFGEAHPHAGLETVTFMLAGSTTDREGELREGDVEWMTAGSGVVHSENAVVSDGLRLFQLWVALPEDRRGMRPRVQRLARDAMPVRRENGVEARVYSGRSGDTEAGTLNAVPITLMDIRLRPNAVFEQDLPTTYNGFVLVLEGELAVGDPATSLAPGQVGWLDRPSGAGASIVSLRAGASAARALLYAGEPLNTAVAARGPFLAGSDAELADRFSAYRRGEFPNASTLPGPPRDPRPH